MKNVKPTENDPTAEAHSPDDLRSSIVASVVRVISGLAEEEFDGIVELQFERGIVVTLRKNSISDDRGNDESKRS